MMSSEASFMPQHFFPHDTGGSPQPYLHNNFAPQMMLTPQIDAYCQPQFPAQPVYASFQVIPQPYVPMQTESRFGSQQAPTTALDSCQQISHVLQCYQQGGEDAEFVRKAIESLVKKLKDKRVELDALITAITSSGKQQTPCVTIQRSLDGRLQVAGRKGVPHVVYARIWRWPNVSKTELMKLPVCSIPSEHQDFICINPYHYERVVSNGMTPLDMKTLRIDPPDEYEMTSSSRQESANFIEWPHTSTQSSILDNFSNDFSCNQRQQYDLNSVHIPNTQVPDFWCAVRYYELDTQVGEILKVHRDITELSIDGGTDPHGMMAGRYCLGALSNVHRGDASDKCRVYIGDGVLLHYLPTGQVTIRVRSRKPIFVRSGFLDYMNRTAFESAHRFVASKEDIIVFDLRWAYNEMSSRTQTASNAMRAQAAAVAGFAAPSGMTMLSEAVAESSVDGMRRAFCTISISFVKGWGSNRYPRTSIKETPCWVEVQLDRPLQLLDLLLKTSGT